MPSGNKPLPEPMMNKIFETRSDFPSYFYLSNSFCCTKYFILLYSIDVVFNIFSYYDTAYTTRLKQMRNKCPNLNLQQMPHSSPSRRAMHIQFNSVLKTLWKNYNAILIVLHFLAWWYSRITRIMDIISHDCNLFWPKNLVAFQKSSIYHRLSIYHG